MHYNIEDSVQYATNVVNNHINNPMALNIQECKKYIYRICKLPTALDIEDLVKKHGYSDEQEMEWSFMPYDIFFDDSLKILEGKEFDIADNEENILSFETIEQPNNIRFKVLAAMLDNLAIPKFDLPYFDDALLTLIHVDTEYTALLQQDKELMTILKDIENCFKGLSPVDHEYASDHYYNPLAPDFSLIKKIDKYHEALDKKYLDAKKNGDNLVAICEKHLLVSTYKQLLRIRSFSDPFLYISGTFNYNSIRFKLSFLNAELFYDMERIYNSKKYWESINTQENYDEYALGAEERFNKGKFNSKIINEEFRKYFVFETCRHFMNWYNKEKSKTNSSLENSGYYLSIRNYENDILNYSAKRNSVTSRDQITMKKKEHTSNLDIHNSLLLSYKLRALQQGFVLPNCMKLFQCADYPRLMAKKKYAKNKTKLISDPNSDQFRITEEWWKQCPYAIKDQEYYDMLMAPATGGCIGPKFIPPKSELIRSELLKGKLPKGKKLNSEQIKSLQLELSKSSFNYAKGTPRPHMFTLHCKKSSIIRDKTNCECLYRIPLEKDLTATEIAYILGFPTRNKDNKRSNEVIKIERLLKKNTLGYAVQDIPNKLYEVWGIDIINVFNTNRNHIQPFYNYHYKHNEEDTTIPVPMNGRLGFIVNNSNLDCSPETLIKEIEKHGGLKKIFAKTKFMKFERYHLEELYKALKNNTYYTKIWLKIPYDKLIQTIYHDSNSHPMPDIPDFPIFSFREDKLYDDLIDEAFSTQSKT